MNSKSLFPDLRSGTVVFLVALPLCLGISLACGVPLLSGIISGVIGGLVVTSLSGSRYSVSGPAAGLTTVVISSIALLGNLQAFLGALVVAGLLQLAFGIVKAGGIGHFIPNAVIKGMLAGIGIILIIKQLPHLVGYDADPEGDMEFFQPDGHNSFSDLYYMLNAVTPGSMLIGGVSILMLILAELPYFRSGRLLKVAPAPLLVVLTAICLNSLLSAVPLFHIEQQHFVSLPVLLSGRLQDHFLFPDFSLIGSQAFWTVVVTLAIVASLETLLSIEAIEKIDPEKQRVNPNRELIAQGVGNTLTGLAGGLPITSVIVRSSANVNSGAKTKLSILIHAVLLLLSVLLFPHFLMRIPNSCLAAILIITGYKLTQVSVFKAEFRAGWDQFLPFVTTIAVMLLTDLLKGVGAGIVVSVIFIIRHNIRSSFEIIEEVIEGRMNYLIKLPQHITFFNKGFVITYLNNLKRDSTVIIDGSINKSTDKDVKEVLHSFIEASRQKNIEIQLVKYTL